MDMHLSNHREAQLNIANLTRLAAQDPEGVTNDSKYGQLLAKYDQEALDKHLRNCRESQLNLVALNRIAALDPEMAVNNPEYGRLLA